MKSNLMILKDPYIAEEFSLDKINLKKISTWLSYKKLLSKKIFLAICGVGLVPLIFMNIVILSVVSKTDTGIFGVPGNAIVYTIFLSAIALTVMFLVGYLSIKIIVRPIEKLIDAAQAISLGHFDFSFKPQKNDEVAQFADSLHRIQTSLQISLNRFKKMRILKNLNDSRSWKC